jgi:uncharacterized protein (DUF305 family)
MKTMTKIFAVLAATSMMSFGSLAMAQETMKGMDMSGAMTGYMGAMDTMMKSMPKESSGNADADFLLMMIPHHQSAIDMAKVELEKGTDKETKAMAQMIIDAQEKEIAEMRSMLERMGVTPPAN